MPPWPTERQAKHIVAVISKSIERMRREMVESLLAYSGGDSATEGWCYEQLSILQPRLFGARSIHVLLEHISDSIDPEQKDGTLSPALFYTILSEAQRLDVVRAELLTLGITLPRPDPRLLSGWYDPQAGLGEESQLSPEDFEGI